MPQPQGRFSAHKLLLPPALHVTLGLMRRKLLWLSAVLLAACDQTPPPAEMPAPASDVVARYTGKVITVDDVQEQLNRRDAFIRMRYTSPEKKKEFLETVVRFELLADEALKKGYQNDPDIIRMYKQWLVARLIQKDFDPQHEPANIPDDEVRAYYEQHKEDFRRPEQALAAEILIKTESLAKKVAESAQKLSKDDGRDFTEMVLNFSEEPGAQQRGGEFVATRDNTSVPKHLLDAVFSMNEPGDIVGPLKSDKGYHIIRLIKKQEAEIPSFEQAEAGVRNTLNKARRDESMTQWVGQLKDQAKLEVFEDKLSQVKIDPDAKATVVNQAPVLKIPELVPGAR